MDSEKNFDKDEFGWENDFRKDDEYVASYISLLKRFADLPESNQLIAQQLGESSEPEEMQKTDAFPECDLNCKQCSHRWNCDFAIPELSDENAEWQIDEDNPGEDDNGNRQGDQSEDEVQAGDILFYENAPSFVLLRQTALGWCNIYATALPSDGCFTGARVLFHISRALTHLAASVGDGLYTYIGANIAFAKRALQDVNQAVGHINELSERHPDLEKLLQTVRGQLLKVREMVLTHLRERRQTNK